MLLVVNFLTLCIYCPMLTPSVGDYMDTGIVVQIMWE